MKRYKFQVKTQLSVGLMVLLVSCLLANLIVVPAFADDAGYALRFDGTSDFVELPRASTVFAPGFESSKTVALWIKPDGVQSSCVVTADPYNVTSCDSIFGDRPTFWGINIGLLPGPNQDRIWVWNYDGSLGSLADIIGIVYTPGVWVHIALVHDGVNLRAFKNGVEVANTPSGPTIQPAPPISPFLSFGGIILSSSEPYLFKGDIDEVSLWNRALTGAELTANMYEDAPTDPTGLAAFYRMSNGSGTVLTDNSGNGRTGTLFDGARGVPASNGPAQWVSSGAFKPSVTINQGASQPDPTNATTITFDVVFSVPVTDFDDPADVDLSASTAPGTLIASISGSGANYTVSVSGISGSGTVVASIPADVAQNAALLGNNASVSTDNSVSFDVSGPTVTINQAPAQADPTNTSPVNFQVIFSEAVTGFTAADVSLSGSAPGTLVPLVSGSGTTYNVAVSGMSGSGTVIASVLAGAVNDGLGNPSSASTSTDNQVSYDNTGPTVTINQAPGQLDPTNVSPVNFQVIFNEVVTDFTAEDVSLSGSAPGTLVPLVSGSGTTYNVAVSGMSGNGTVIASVPAGGAHDAAGNPSSAGTSTDNQVSYDSTAPTVTINQALGQSDPAISAPVNFQVIFSETVTGFSGEDVNLAASTTPGTLSAFVSGSGTTYNVAISGMSGSGTVIASLPAGVAIDSAGNGNNASTSSDNQVTYDATALTVTINQAPGQPDPTNDSPVLFQVVFSRSVTDFIATDVNLTASTTPGTLSASIDGAGANYTVSVSGMSGSGNVIASIPAGSAHDSGGNPNTLSTSSDNTVSYDTSGPTVTINPAPGQADPTNTPPVVFRVVFSESVNDFDATDVSLAASTTPGPLSALVSGGGTTYDVTVSGMSGSGTVIASIAAGRAHDAAGNGNSAGTGDNSVIYDVGNPTVTINKATGQADPTNASPVTFAVIFSETVTGFSASDVNLSASTTPGTLSASIDGSGPSYTVSVSGMSGNGTVIASIPAGAVIDSGGNGNSPSTSTDNQVAFDITAPTVTINQAPGQLDPTNAATIAFQAVFSEAVTEFTSADVNITGTAGATSAVVSGGNTIFTISISTMSLNGTVIAFIPAGVARDAAGNLNTASTIIDNQVLYDTVGPTVAISLAPGQANPTNTSPVVFRVVFSEAVDDFSNGDVMLTGTAGATIVGVTAINDTTYTVSVNGMTRDGTVIISIPVGAAHDAAGNGNAASPAGGNQVTYDNSTPTVTINQAPGQSDPTIISPILFRVVFSEVVIGFATGDVSLSGSAPGTLTAAVSGSGATYTVTVSGMTGSGTVIASILAGVAQDAVGNTNLASTSSDPTVTYTHLPNKVYLPLATRP